MSRLAIAPFLSLCLTLPGYPAFGQAPGANRPVAVAELRDAPASRRSRVALRLDAPIRGCPDQSRIYTANELPDGSTRLTVWRLTLEQR